MSTIFEKIIDGELAGSFVYKDEVVVAFLDINPANEGHCLVVPRVAYANLEELPPDIGGRMFAVAQKVAGALRTAFPEVCGVNLLLSDGEHAGQEVPHVHLHVMPRVRGDGVTLHYEPLSEEASVRKRLEVVASQLITALV